MLPPSNGSTGTRLNTPITGPAHQSALAISDALRTESMSSGLTPIIARIAHDRAICVPGPAKEMPARSQLFNGRVGVNAAYP
jgi:hypothetical protein